MYWEKPFTKTNGLPRKYFKSLKLPRGMPVKDGETLSVGVSYGEEFFFGNLSVSGGGELVLPTKLAGAIASFAAANPEDSVHFTCEDSWEGAILNGSEVRPAQFQEMATTEREALISARIGQGVFRARLMNYWKGRCAVTGVNVSPMLRASHIKPWRLSSNKERLDPENGLLLIANLDAAFDAKLISFDDWGLILYSERLGSDPHSILGASIDARLNCPPSIRQQDFLELHRQDAGLT